MVVDEVEILYVNSRGTVDLVKLIMNCIYGNSFSILNFCFLQMKFYDKEAVSVGC
jgi:hypothetical protein